MRFWSPFRFPQIILLNRDIRFLAQIKECFGDAHDVPLRNEDCLIVRKEDECFQHFYISNDINVRQARAMLLGRCFIHLQHKVQQAPILLIVNEAEFSKFAIELRCLAFTQF